MESSFIALYNKKGIACASDTDMSLYSLYGNDPNGNIVCIAVDPHSQFPWEMVINDFLKKGGFNNSSHNSLEGFANEFLGIIKSRWNDKYSLIVERSLFLGFCQNDVFPTVIKVSPYQIEHSFDTLSRSKTGMLILGDFESMESFRYGISRDSSQSYQNAIYVQEQAVMGYVKGTEQEDFIINEIKQRNTKKSFEDVRKDREANFHEALDSFNVEDMVRTAEMFLNFNAQFHRLKNKKESLRFTRELAVITRTEGLKWIKHCLYG